MNTLSLFNTLFNDMDYCTPSFARAAKVSNPRVDVTEKKESYDLEMELPGMTGNDVDIELKDGVLTIASKKSEEAEKQSDKSDDVQWLIKECRSYEFARRFTLPQDIDEDGVSAEFKNGVLSVRIPRKALPSPKKIAITAA